MLLSIAFIINRKHFLCLPDKKLGVPDAIDLRIRSGILNCLWNNLHTVYFLCLFRKEKRDRSDPAVKIPYSFAAVKFRILQSQ